MKKILFLIFCGIIIGLFLSLMAAEMIERTSGVTFCSSCHSMKGVSRSYAEDIHGGMNPLGFKAKCTDCHLPHDSVFHYLTAKAYTGAKDVLGEIFWAKSFDWIANLQNKEDFTYTSGCLKCHDLGAIHYDIPKAFSAHKDFLSGKVKSCLQCHENVGHKNIKDFLVKQH
jgi:cytochrome c-type protein NapC